MFLWDCFLNVGNWVHYFNPQVECLKNASVHLDEMVKEFYVPLFKGIKQRLLTVGSELFLGHVFSRLGLELPVLVDLDVVLSNECSL